MTADLGLERSVRLIVDLLSASTDQEETIELMRVLGQIGDPGAVLTIEKRAVRKLLSKPPTAVRVAAYEALDRIGTPHARLLVNKALSDRDPVVRRAVEELQRARP